MINVRQEINDKLATITGIGKVVRGWPKDFPALPLIAFSVDNRKPIGNFVYDQDSEITVVVNMWDSKSVSQLAIDVSAKMAELGYTRIFEKDMDELGEDKIRITQRYKAFK